jgi:NTE family protein
MLNSAFIDSLESDIERLDRVNKLLGGADQPERRSSSSDRLRRIQRLVISPTEDLDQIAARNVAALPPSLRRLLKMTGGTEGGGGATAASYLLFARPFVESLIKLGYRDAMWSREEIAAFQHPSY